LANFGDILSGLSIGAGQSVRRNAGNTDFEAFTPSSGLSIGNAVSGGGANRILFEDGSSNLATDADFYFTSDGLYIGSGFVGEWAGGGGYAAFGHKTALASNANKYAVLQNSAGDTYFNSGSSINFRINNADKFIINDGYAGFNAAANSAVAFWLSPAASNKFALLIQGLASQSAPLLEIRDSSSATKFQIDSNYDVNLNGHCTPGDGKNFIFGTSTGTKIGTGTSQRIGFFNATPVTQRANIGALTDSTSGSVTSTLSPAGATYDDGTLNDNFAALCDRINKIEQVLQDIGITN
jgi:hypothetical protein